MSSQSLKSLLEGVAEGEVVLPQFQRDFVWQPAAVVKLMTSIFNGYPIGALLLMENNGAYDFRLLDGVADSIQSDDKETDLVLDGQQRLTSCYRSFYGTLEKNAKLPGRYYFDLRKFIDATLAGDVPEGSALEEYFVFKRAAYVTRNLNSTVAEQSVGLFPLDIIFGEPRGADYAFWLSSFATSEAKGDEGKLKRLHKITSQFQTRFIEKVTGYQVNYEKIIKNTNPDVICTIFETINTTGVKLTVFDLLVAKCFKKNIRLRDKLVEALEQYVWLKKFDSDGSAIAIVQLPRILGMLIRGECKKGVILNLDPERIGEKWDQSVSALDRALKVLYSRYGCLRSDLIPAMDAIAPLSLIVSDPRFNMDEHGSKLDRWYWTSVFSQYLAGAPESKIAKTLKEWLGDSGWLFNDEVLPEVVRDFQFRPSSLESAAKNSSVYKGLMSLMLSRAPADLGVDRRPLDGVSAENIHDHHIFPLKFLQNSGIKGPEANQIANRMPIWKVTNEKLSSLSPQVYLEDRSLTHARVMNDMKEQYFCDASLAIEEFTHDGFRLFCMDRREKFINLISETVCMNLNDIIPREDI